MSTIRNTVESLATAVPSTHRHIVESVITALEEREQGALDVIQQKGVALGATTEQIEAILIEAGLVEPTPEPEPVVNAEPQDVQAQIASLADELRTLSTTLNNALAAARRQGVRI